MCICNKTQLYISPIEGLCAFARYRNWDPLLLLSPHLILGHDIPFLFGGGGAVTVRQDYSTNFEPSQS